MHPFLAAIDFEALIWVIIAVVYFIAQIVGQFTKKSDGEEEESGRGVPDEIREFLEEIQGKRAQEEEEEHWPPPPPPGQKRPPPIRHQRSAQPPPPRPPTLTTSTKPPTAAARRSTTSDTSKIGKALEERRKKFQHQLQKQARQLSESQLMQKSREIQPNLEVEHDHGQGQDYLSAGLKGFKLPSIGLPGNLTNAEERSAKHKLSIHTPENLREALILSVVLGEPVSSQPPGCSELTRNQ